MGVMCNNSFLVQIKTEGYELTKEQIAKILDKRLKQHNSIYVIEYVPPPPKMKVFPERKVNAGDWTTVIKGNKKTKGKKREKGKVFCKNCKYYVPKPQYVSKLDDLCDCSDNFIHETKNDNYLEPCHDIVIGHYLTPKERNQDNLCAGYKPAECADEKLDKKCSHI